LVLIFLLGKLVVHPKGSCVIDIALLGELVGLLTDRPRHIIRALSALQESNDIRSGLTGSLGFGPASGQNLLRQWRIAINISTGHLTRPDGIVKSALLFG